MNFIKFVSAKTIFPEYLDSTKIEHGINPRTYLTWIANVIEKADIPITQIAKEERITIKNYRGLLPCDLNLINQFQYQGQGMHYASNTRSPYHDPDSIDIKRASPNSYSIQWPYVCPSFRDGELLLYYYAIPTDEEGFPLVPDNAEFREACIRYFVWKNKYAQAASGKITFNEQKQWENDFGNQLDKAIMDMSFPTPDRWYGIASRFMRIIPSAYDQQEMFNTQGIESL